MNERDWRTPLLALEDPDIDPGERHRLANVVRDAVEELERGLAAGAQRGSEVLRKVIAPPGPRERSVVAWRRGSSFSIKADGPEDAAWLEELASDPPAAFRVRPSAAAAKKLAENAPKTWGQGIRALVLCIRPDPKVFAEEPARAYQEAVDAADKVPGDWIVMGLVRRNLGGHSARALIVTFGFVSIDGVREAPPEPEEQEQEDEEGEG